MARFARIDSQIRAHRLILANRFRVPELNTLFFSESCFVGLKIANRRFEAICANRPDSRCESPARPSEKENKHCSEGIHDAEAADVHAFNSQTSTSFCKKNIGQFFRKILAPIKIKSALPPPKNPKSPPPP